MLTISHIKDFALLHADIAYILITLGVIIEGEIMVIIAGIFAHLGSFNIFVALIATIAGGVIKSVIGYNIGYYLYRKHSDQPLVCGAERRINRFLPRFSDKPFISLFLSRFLIFGIYWFALIYAGYKHIPLRTFIKAEISSLITWSILMLSLGYFFSYTALSISRDVGNFFGIILIFFIGFFVLEKILAFVVQLFKVKEVQTNVNF